VALGLVSLACTGVEDCKEWGVEGSLEGEDKEGFCEVVGCLRAVLVRSMERPADRKASEIVW
jgi:hypothetical protein